MTATVHTTANHYGTGTPGTIVITSGNTGLTLTNHHGDSTTGVYLTRAQAFAVATDILTRAVSIQD